MKRISPLLSMAALLLLEAPLPVLAATDPAMPGPYSTAVVNVDAPVTAGRTLNADVHYPAQGGGVDPAAGTCPPVVFAHGFSRNKDRYTDLGTLLASRGFLAILPNFPCSFTGCDHSRNADDLRAVVDWILARNADPTSPFFGRVDTAHVGASGHSAGGLWSLVAAGRDSRIAAVAPLDPVDNAALGAGALPGARAAIAVTYSEPSSCNANGSAETLYAAAPPQKRGAKIVGGNHCDPEKNNDLFGCALLCGSWNQTRHESYLRAVVGWFEYYLHCDHAYEEWTWGSRVGADVSAGVVAYDAALAPPAPTGASASWEGAVIVRRDPPLRCAGVSAWRVYRGTAPGGPFTLVSGDLPVAATAWTDPSATAGGTYFYALRDVFRDFRSEAESADSPQPSITVPAAGGPGEASGLGRTPLTARREPGESVRLEYAPAPCATDHVVYWGMSQGALTGPLPWTGQACSLGASGQAAFDPGPAPSGTVLYFVVAGNDGSTEGPYGSDSAGGQRPHASGLPLCSFPPATTPCP